MKKTALLSLAAVAAMSLVACGSNTAEETTTAATTAAETEAATEEAEETETAAETEETEAEENVTEEQIFVPVDWVAEVVADQIPGYEDAIIAEASWGPVDQNEPYQTAHIPGAIHIDTDSVEDYDKYNIFSFDILSENLAGYGITVDTPLIIYGDDPSAASRVVLAASYAGVKNVKLMNGNMSTWTDAGNETEEGIVEPVAAESFGAEEAAHPEYLISCADVREKIDSDDNFRLVSIRSTEEFEGLTSGYSYIDYAGEPKGAVWGHAGVNPYDMSERIMKPWFLIWTRLVLQRKTKQPFTAEPDGEPAFPS